MELETEIFDFVKDTSTYNENIDILDKSLFVINGQYDLLTENDYFHIKWISNKFIFCDKFGEHETENNVFCLISGAFGRNLVIIGGDKNTNTALNHVHGYYINFNDTNDVFPHWCLMQSSGELIYMIYNKCDNKLLWKNDKQIKEIINNTIFKVSLTNNGWFFESIDNCIADDGVVSPTILAKSKKYYTDMNTNIGATPDENIPPTIIFTLEDDADKKIVRNIDFNLGKIKIDYVFPKNRKKHITMKIYVENTDITLQKIYDSNVTLYNSNYDIVAPLYSQKNSIFIIIDIQTIKTKKFMFHQIKSRT